MKKLLFLLALFSLLHSAIPEGADYSGSVDESLRSGYLTDWASGQGWFFYCILAVIIASGFLAIVYMLARALDARNLEVYVKSEFLQVAGTAVMVIALLTMIQGAVLIVSQAATESVLCGDVLVPDPIDAAICINQQNLEDLDKMYDRVWNENIPYERAYHITHSAWGIMIFQGSWVPEIHKPVETYHMLAEKIAELEISLNAQLFILKYIKANMLAIFIPMGIILRAFHFTRGLGGFFIALGISLYFIYPTVLYMLEATMRVTPPELPPIANMDSGMCNIPMFGGFSFGSAGLTMGMSGSSTAGMMTSTDSIAGFLSQVFLKNLYTNMVALSVALTAFQFGSAALNVDSAVFVRAVSKWL